MKKFILSIAFISSLFILSNCGKNDPGPSDPMYGAWEVKSITRDGVDYTSYYSKTKLTISAGTYNITSLPNPTPFQNNGTVSLSNKSLQQGDGLVFTYVNISPTEIQFSFVYSGAGYPGGRIGSTNQGARVSGNWDVDLVKR